MEHFEDFCRIPSLHGENGLFCKSGKRSFGDFKMSLLNDVIPGVQRIERMKWSIFEDFCRIPSLHGENGMFCKSGKEVLEISRCPC